jgi:pyruvate,water dikinase
MRKVAELLKRTFSKANRAERTLKNTEELRAAFSARYHHFKLLLNANNKALDIMAELEQALTAGQPFGMTFVRARCTALSVNVFQMIRNLDAIAPGKYAALGTRFRQIQEEIHKALTSTPKEHRPGARMVVPLAAVDKDMADEVGTKMANLGEIGRRLGMAVPPGFVITSWAYRRFLTHNDLQAEIDRLLQSTDVEKPEGLYELSAAIQQRLVRASVPDDLAEAILEAYRGLEALSGKGVSVSMRSSALGEDVAGTSFAGQYRSVLNVSADNLIDTYKEIVAGKYNLPAMTYRLTRGIRDEDIAMCVGCMVMVQAVAGGVVYSRNPVRVRDASVVINAAWGLPKAVVDGAVTADVIVVSRGEPLRILRKEIASKEYAFESSQEEGVLRIELPPDKRTSASITDEQAVELARRAIALEDYYGVPQDIEWAIAADGSIYILQCRPLQQVGTEGGEQKAAEPEPRGPVEQIIFEGGVTASPGAGFGPVYVVHKNADALTFPRGAVLVVAQPLPRWAAALPRAAAVIAEQGGVGGHLASVAREFGVPALFNVPGATRVLGNGEQVTVDADTRTVYRGRVEALVGDTKQRKNLMVGSPVYEVLCAVKEHITPLTLLDPDAPTFKPQRCRTLHDITRFAHEKSVQEMFRFGREHNFPERASKQLVCEVPMQWWVIDLDDGFAQEVQGPTVPLEAIVSIPMRALWEGITAVPWQGPPQVDTKGFLSVMFQATVNTSLDPAMRSEYAARNYFMISKHFCSLQSRFGFHFSTVETLVGERPPENYISFQFKGGAADLERRVRRIQFVAGVLSRAGFLVEIREDALFARLEGHPEEYMKARLRVLGYLIIHTRQLDMIMTNEAALNRHRAKILADVEALLGPPPTGAVVDSENG